MNKCDKLRELLLQWADKYYLPLRKELDHCDSERLRYRDMAQKLYLENKELKREVMKLRYGVVPEEKNEKQYVVYNKKTDEVVCVGTAEECARRLNVKLENFKWKLTPTARSRPGRYEIVDLNKLEREEALENQEVIASDK